MYKGILDWIDRKQFREIMTTHGVSKSTMYRIINEGPQRNKVVFDALVHAAEENKLLIQRARQLEQTPA